MWGLSEESDLTLGRMSWGFFWKERLINSLMKCCQQAVSYSSPQFQFSTGFFAAPPLGCICKRLYKPLKLLGYSLELASQWHSDLKPMPSAVVLLWFVIILWEKGYREKACWFCVSVCVTNKLNPFGLAITLPAKSMEEWWANLSFAVVTFVAFLAITLLLRDWSTTW